MSLLDRLFAPRPSAGVTVDLLEVTPHGGDLHLVSATVDGVPFQNYVPSGDLRGLDPDALRRALAIRVRGMVKPPVEPPALTGREERIP